MQREINTERNSDKFQTALPSVPEMIEALTQYYEATGFSDVGTHELKGKSVDELRKLYIDVFCKEEDVDESWRYSEEER